MNNQDILKIAIAQSAIDANCAPEDFLKSVNVVVKARIGVGARSYYTPPIAANLISYGNNIVASVEDEYRDVVAEYISKYEFYHCFETPNLHALNEKLLENGQKVCFMAEYFLPDMRVFKRIECKYRLEVLTHGDFEKLYLPEWSNALCAKRRQLDALGVGAYDGQKLIGLAGCSADCGSMWQIGVDVLPEYRGQGVGSALTSNLAAETMERGKVPFYCCAWSNIRSARNAIRSGFRPAWVEMTVKPKETVDKMNN